MIVWTWIKRISCLIGKSIWFLFAEVCVFATAYIATMIFFVVLAIKENDGIFFQCGIFACIAIFIIHRISVIVIYSGQPWDRSERNERQRQKIQKYVLLVRECLTMK